MNKPILGKDVVLQFDDGDGFGNYFCAIDVEISFQMETKETKTIGTGSWTRKRGQKKSAVINLDGVQALSELFSTAFTMLDYFNNMTDIPFRIIFTDEQHDIKVIQGVALPTDVSLSGGSEGHANGSITIEVNGPVDIRDSMSQCDSAIIDGTYFKSGTGVHQFRVGELSEDSPTITRYDFQLDGGGTQSAFSSGSLPFSFGIAGGGPNAFSASPVGSSHTIVVTPICENGYPGSTFTLNFLKQ